MKTVLFHTHGGSEFLNYADFPAPVPKPGKALAQMEREKGLKTGDKSCNELGMR